MQPKLIFKQKYNILMFLVFYSTLHVFRIIICLYGQNLNKNLLLFEII